MPYLKTKPEIQGDFTIGGKTYSLKETPGAINEAQRQAALEWDKCFKRFYLSKSSRLTPAALRQVEWALVPHLREMIEQGVIPSAYTDEHIELRNSQRLGKGISNTTIRQDHMMLNAMFKVCLRSKLVKRNPVEGVKMPPKVKAYIDSPTRPGLITLLKAVHDQHRPSKNSGCVVLGQIKNVYLWRRDTAIIALAARTGMRPAEIFRLVMADYQPDEGRIAVRLAKDNEYRFVPIYADVMNVMSMWFKERPKNSGTDYIFLTDRFLQMRVNSWSKEFKKYAIAADMPAVTPRTLRHFAINEMAEENLLAASAAAGHSTLSTTKKYLHNNFSHTKKALANVACLEVSGIGDGRRTKRQI